MKQYDTIIHLLDKTALPTYMAIKQFDCPRHILAVTHETEHAFNVLQTELDAQGCHTEKVNLPRDDLNGCRRRLGKVFGALPDGRHAFNLTSGSRSMFAALFELGHEKHVPSFYLEPQTRTLNWLDEKGYKEPLVPVMKHVSDFIRLAGCRVDEAQLDEQLEAALTRDEAAMACWQYRKQLSTWSKSLRTQARKPGQPFRDGPRKIAGISFSAVLKKPKDNSKGTIHMGEQVFTIKPWKQLAAFLSGDWYRDAVLARLMALKRRGRICDIRVGARPSSDILFTDGLGLTLIGTRLTRLDQAMLRGMEEQVDLLAGDFGHGIMAVAEDGRKNLPRPSSDSRVRIITGASTISHPEQFLDASEE